MELTTCFESGYKEAAARKRRRYIDLQEEAQQEGYHTHILPIQIGSRGVSPDNSLEVFRHSLKPMKQRTWQAFLTEIVGTTTSHQIWCARNHINCLLLMYTSLHVSCFCFFFFVFL